MLHVLEKCLKKLQSNIPETLLRALQYTIHWVAVEDNWGTDVAQGVRWVGTERVTSDQVQEDVTRRITDYNSRFVTCGRITWYSRQFVRVCPWHNNLLGWPQHVMIRIYTCKLAYDYLGKVKVTLPGQASLML